MTEVARDAAHASVLLDLKRYDEAVSLLALVVTASRTAGRGACWPPPTLGLAGMRKPRPRPAARSPLHLQMTGRTGWQAPPKGTWATSPQHSPRRTRHASSLRTSGEPGICLAQAQLATEVDFIAAERAAASALRLAPSEPDAHFTAGQVAFAQERWKAARAHQERALSLDPAHSGALNELGRIRARRGDLPRAARHFIQAVRSAPAVSTYAANVEVVIRRVLALTIRAAYTVSCVLLVLTMATSAPRQTVGIGYTVTIALIAGYGAVQLRRMPPEMRPLLQTRRVALAVGVVYGAVFIAMIAAAVTPARVLPGVMLAVTALIVASSFIERLLLPSKSNQAGRGAMHDGTKR